MSSSGAAPPELLIALDALVDERALSASLRSALETATADLSASASACTDARRAAAEAETRVIEERRAVEEQLRSLRISLAARDAALARAESATASVRDVAQLRQSVREEVEAPMIARIAALEAELKMARSACVEAERDRDVALARGAADLAASRREAAAAAEASAAAVATMNARVNAIEIAGDEAAAESAAALRRARDESARAVARARSLDVEALALREERDSSRAEAARAATVSAREIADLRDSVRTADLARAAAERASESAIAEAAALRETNASILNRLAESHTEALRAGTALSVRVANDSADSQSALARADQVRADAARTSAVLLERALAAEERATNAESALRAARADAERELRAANARADDAESVAREISAATHKARRATGGRALQMRPPADPRPDRSSVDTFSTDGGMSAHLLHFKPIDISSSAPGSRSASPLAAPQSHSFRAALASPLTAARRAGVPPLPAPTPASLGAPRGGAASTGSASVNNSSGDETVRAADATITAPTGAGGADDSTAERSGGGEKEPFFAPDAYGDEDLHSDEGGVDFEENAESVVLFGYARRRVAKLERAVTHRDGQIQGLRQAILGLRADLSRAANQLSRVSNTVNESVRARREAETRAAEAEGRLDAALAAADEAGARAVEAERALAASDDRAVLESGSALRAAHTARAAVLAQVEAERFTVARERDTAVAAAAAAAKKAAAYKSKLMGLFLTYGKLKEALADRDARLASAELQMRGRV